MDTNAIERKVKATMKARAKQEETPTRVGSPVVMSEWKTEFLKVAENEKQSEIQKYIGENPGTEIKDSKGERVTAIQYEHVLASIEVAKLKIEDKPYDMEFVALTAVTAYGRLLLCNGVDDLTEEKDKDGKPVLNTAGEPKEVPSVTKYFNTAFSQNARNAAAARVRTIVEGPEKALASAAKKLAQVWGISVEAAAARIAKMAE